MCIHCHTFLIFDEGEQVRFPTEEEQLEIDSNAEVSRIRTAAAELDRQEGKS